MIEEFRRLQRDLAADVYFCLPASGMAWIRTAGDGPQPAQPQLLRILALLAEVPELPEDVVREGALGPSRHPAALDKAVSRCRALLKDLGFPGAVQRVSGGVKLQGVRLAGLVSPVGRRPDVRIRRTWGDDFVGCELPGS